MLFEGEITYNADVHSVAGAQRPRFQIDEKEERGEDRENNCGVVVLIINSNYHAVVVVG